jgi:hypothetical protein
VDRNTSSPSPITSQKLRKPSNNGARKEQQELGGGQGVHVELDPTKSSLAEVATRWRNTEAGGFERWRKSASRRTERGRHTELDGARAKRWHALTRPWRRQPWTKPRTKIRSKN